MSKFKWLRGKKKRIRDLRKGVKPMKTSSGKDFNKVSDVTHRMEWSGDLTKRRGDFAVYPTVRPKDGKNSSKPEDWEPQTEAQAHQRGERIKVKSQKNAASLAAGSWKKNKDKETKEFIKDERKRVKARLKQQRKSKRK